LASASTPPEIDAAVRQIMMFLAENELSALYLPSKFISRHIDAFLKRARLAGGLAISSVTTSRSHTANFM
jgi:hypothetical protein